MARKPSKRLRVTRYSKKNRWWADLAQVATISEVASLWYVSRETVQYWIDRGYIVAVQSGKTWLISVDSVISYRGKFPSFVDKQDT